MRKKFALPLCTLLLALILVFSSVPAMGEAVNATVKQTYTGLVHLRAEPSAQSASLGTFPAGTPVQVYGVAGNWAYVTVYGTVGFMNTQMLDGDLSGVGTGTPPPAAPAETPVPTAVQDPVTYTSGWISDNTTMYIYTGNSGRLHLREYPSRDSRSLGLYSNGTTVQVLARNGDWGYVNVLGASGYMMLRYLTASYSPVTPPISGDWVTMYIYTGNSGRLHLRQSASRSSRSLGLYANGTQLSAIDLGNGWCYVNVYGATGYMMTRYLSITPVSPNPDGSPIGTAVVRHPNNSFVYLRSSRSTATTANVLAKVPSGTTVTVYERDEWYCRISYNGMTGYMVSWYLYGSSSGSSSGSSVPTGGSVIESRTVRHPNNSFVYMRSSRSTASTANVLCKVPSGSVVDVYEKDEWYCRIYYNGMFGYMVTQYLYGSSSSSSSSSGIPISGSPIDTAVVHHPNNSFVYLRSSRSTASTANVICKVPSGSVVDVYEKGEWYCKIVYNGLGGYMVTSYLYGSSSGTGVRVWASNGGSINLRSSCSTQNGNNILTQMPCGSPVQLLEWGSTWSRIQYNGIMGYVMTTFLQVW